MPSLDDLAEDTVGASVKGYYAPRSSQVVSAAPPRSTALCRNDAHVNLPGAGPRTRGSA